MRWKRCPKAFFQVCTLAIKPISSLVAGRFQQVPSAHKTEWRDIKALQNRERFPGPPPSNSFLSSRLFPLPKRKKKVGFHSQSKSGFPYQMDHITLCRDNRDIPSLLCFSSSRHRTPTHSRSPSLCVCLSFFLTHRFSLWLSEEVGGLIKSLLRAEPRHGEGGAEARKRRGRAKSIPQVNLRPEIFYTINKQGESGDWMREGTVGGGGGGVLQRDAAEDICSLHATLLPCSLVLPGEPPHHRKGWFFYSDCLWFFFADLLLIIDFFFKLHFNNLLRTFWQWDKQKCFKSITKVAGWQSRTLSKCKTI